LNNQLTQKGN